MGYSTLSPDLPHGVLHQGVVINAVVPRRKTIPWWWFHELIDVRRLTGVLPSNVIRWLKPNPRDHNGTSPHYTVHLLLSSSGSNVVSGQQLMWISDWLNPSFLSQDQTDSSIFQIQIPKWSFLPSWIHILSGHQVKMFCLWAVAGSILTIGTLEFGNWRLTFALSVFRFRE